MKTIQPSHSDSVRVAIGILQARWPTIGAPTLLLFRDVFEQAHGIAVESARAFVRSVSTPDLSKLVDLMVGLREKARYEAETEAFAQLPSAPVVTGSEAKRRADEIRAILRAPKPDPSEYPPRRKTIDSRPESFASKFGHWTPEKTAARKAALVRAALAAWKLDRKEESQP